MVELDTFYILNMTKVTITSHPDYEERNKRAQIIATPQPLPSLSKKSRFHLLAHASVDPSEYISQGNFQESELSTLNSQKFGILTSRTSLELINLEIFSESTEIFVIASYLQDLQITLSKNKYNCDYREHVLEHLQHSPSVIRPSQFGFVQPHS